MPSIGVCIKLNQIQTRTNLGHTPQWKKWRQIQKFLGILLKIILQSKIKGPLTEVTQEVSRQAPHVEARYEFVSYI